MSEQSHQAHLVTEEVDLLETFILNVFKGESLVPT
jgi:hypothetical protein